MMMIHWASAATAPGLFFSSSSVVVESAVETSMASAGAASGASAVA